MKDYQLSFETWLKKATDLSVRQSLEQMKQDEAAKQDAFYTDMEFGTAGLRGVMEAGTNRLNVYTVYRATKGVALYMQKHGYTSCAITYDSRNNSQLFSQVSAATLAASGIKVYITKECMPTPYLSFMVRAYHADMGINVTASHNAAQYNGYKVYDNQGCQLTDEAANEVTEFIQTVDPFGEEIPQFSKYENGLVVYSDSETEEAYKQSVLAQGLNSADGIKLVYSPLNGAGHRIVPEVLRRVGVSDLIVVPQQSMPDGNFPTCPYPNPEMAATLSLAIDLAKQHNADAVVANDPDCDRMGVAVRGEAGFEILSGNDIGLLLADYILCTQKNLPKNPVLVKTIVTTLMIDALAKKHGAQVVDVLTGFKYIGDTITKLEQKGQADRFIFGFEESCGFLKGSYVRDKDGVVAAMLFAQCVAHYKKIGKTLLQRREELRAELGNFVQQTFRYTFGGIEGVAKKEQLFADLRMRPLEQLGDSKIVASCDFLTQTTFDLPKANVLRYNSADGSQIILRPSGTEPLVKCYVSVVGSEEEVKQKFQKIKAQLDKLVG